MVKKMTITFVVLAMVGSLSFAQSRNVVNERWVMPSNSNPVIYSNGNHDSKAVAPGQELFKTEYDYMQNNAIDNMMALYDLDADGDLDPLMTGMQRFNAGARQQRFAYIAFGAAPDNFSAFDETVGTSGSGTYGFGNMQVCVGGDLDGNALMFAHSNGNSWHSVIDLTNLVPVTPFPTVNIAGNFPSFVYLTDGTIIMNNTNAVYYSSSDYGATFDSLFVIGDGDPNFGSAFGANAPSEIPIWKSDDDAVIASVWAGDAGVAPANPDIVYWYGSTDGGATWGGLIAGVGSGTLPEYGQVINRNYAPYFTNFSQLNANVSDDGTTHIVINGYGEGVLPSTTDTVNVFPVLYWNSNHQDWIAVTDPLTEAPTDGFGNFVTGGTTTRLYSGNGIGQAYPNVSTSTDGRIVFVAWQGFEYTGAIGSSAWNIYPGDGGADSGPIYYLDLYYSWSSDFGVTWSDPAILKGDADVMEQDVYMARRIEFQGTTATVHYMYMEDVIPGAAIFTGQVAGQNSYSQDTRWLYDSFSWTVPGVGDDNIVVNDFTLDQNYPNPFNPSTTINYTLAERSAITLKVYDVLGNEVASLVNTTQEAGKYDVKFDASSLSSGLYIYTLNTGNFTSSRKMMLLK